MKKALLLLSYLLTISLFNGVFANTWTVTNRNDDGSSGSLRWAINQANSDGTAPVVIEFAIPASQSTADGKYLINLNNNLPELNNYNNLPITIDGGSQDPSACEPMIIIRGNAGGGSVGFRVPWQRQAHISGFIIQNVETGVVFDGGNNPGSVTRCWIGLTGDGSAIYNNGISRQGISVTNGQNVVIGGHDECDRNVISGTMQYSAPDFHERMGAVYVTENSDNVEIIGNYIGFDKTGTTVLGNGIDVPFEQSGIKIFDNSDNALVEDNVIGGSAGNAIWLGDKDNGGNCDNAEIYGNLIGVDVTGLSTAANMAAGIRIDASNDTRVGGEHDTLRNVISSNGGADDSRPCGQQTWIDCGGPCEFNACPQSYDATLNTGIYLWDVNDSYIQGNYIGTDGTGNSTGTDKEFGNLYAGIKIEGVSSNNVIGGSEAGRNIISGNGWDLTSDRTGTTEEYVGHGIQLNYSSVTATEITHNYIGIGADGSTPLGNRQDGISVLGSSNNIIANNVISDNSWGVFLQIDFNSNTHPSGNIITGNLLGTDATGTAKIGNGIRNDALVVDDDGGGLGIQHGAHDNTIGGTASGERNIISGNRNGIVLRDGEDDGIPHDNTFLNNYVGVDISGTTALPNEENGVWIFGDAYSNIFGGTTNASGNIISGNANHGIFIENGDENSFFFNKIGVDADGNEMGNGGDGIAIATAGSTGDAGSVGNIIGYTDRGNTIAYNGASGITVDGTLATDNAIHDNSIYCNAERGIVLRNGGNEEYAPPASDLDNSILTFEKAGAYIEVYSAGECFDCESDPESDKLQGDTLLASGMGSVSITAEEGKYYTATASETAPGLTPGSTQNTSEFTPCRIYCLPPSTVEITTSDDLEICEGDPFPTFTGTVSDDGNMPYSYEWYIGSTRADSSGTLSPFTPTAEGDVKLVVYSSDGSDCFEESEAVSVVENNEPEVPTVSVAPSATICEPDSVILSASGSGTYTWVVNDVVQTDAESNELVLSAAGDYDVEVYVSDETTACSSDTSAVQSVTISEMPETPVISAAPSAEVCEPETVTLTATGSGTFTWIIGGVEQTDSTDNDIVLSAAGTHDVEVYASDDATSCPSDTSAVQSVTINELPEAPEVSVAPAGEVCTPDTVTLTATGTGTFNWYDGEDIIGTGSELKLYNVGTYDINVEVTSGEGCTSDASDAESVTINETPEQPEISADGPAEFCEGGSVELTASTNMTGVTITWYNDLVSTTESIGSGASVTVDTSGQYRAVVETADGCTAPDSDHFDVIVNPNPVISDVSAGDPLVFCEGGSVELTATGTLAGAGTISGYTWYRVDSPSDVVVSTANPANIEESGSYYVVAESDAGCLSENSDTLEVTENENPEAPVVDVAPASEVCEGETVSLSINAPEPGYTYEWSNGETGTSIELTATGTSNITVTATDNTTACTGPESSGEQITINPLPVITLDPAGDIPVCKGKTLDLNITSSTSGVSWEWYQDGSILADSSDEQTITVATEGMYKVVVENDITGCSDSDSANITFTTQDYAEVGSASGGDYYCEDSSMTLSASPADGDSYIWYEAGDPDNILGTNSTLSVSAEGHYRVIIEQDGGCLDTADAYAVAEQSKPAASIAAPEPICNGESITLDGAASGGVGMPVSYTYNWNNGDGTEEDFVITPDEDVDCYLVVTDDSTNCLSDTASVTITVNDNPELQVEADEDEICEGESATLTATPSGAGGYSYTWLPATDGTAQPTVTPAETTTYKVVVEDANNCSSDTAEVNVVVNALPEVEASADNPAVCSDDSTTLQAVVSGAEGEVSYVWTPGSLTEQNPKIGPETTTTYEVVVTDENNCSSAADQVTVEVNERPVASLQPENTEICAGESVDLSVDVNPAGGTYSYRWLDDNTETSADRNVGPLTETDSFMVVVTDQVSGCESYTDTAFVVVNDNPEPSVAGPDKYCEDDSFIYEVNGGTNSAFTWSVSGAAYNTFTADDSVRVNFEDNKDPVDVSVTEVNSETGCEGTATKTVEHDIILELDIRNSDFEICENETLVIRTSINHYSSVTYEWYYEDNLIPGADSSSYPVTRDKDGTYDVVVSSDDACSGSSDGIEVVGYDNPDVSLNIIGDYEATCEGQDVDLYAAASPELDGGAEYEFEWFDGTTNDSITVTSGRINYGVTVTNPLTGCSSGRTLNLPNIVVNLELPDTLDICLNDEKLLEGFMYATHQSALKFTWDFIDSTGATSKGESVHEPVANEMFYAYDTDFGTLSEGRDIYTVYVEDTTTGCDDTEVVVVNTQPLPEVELLTDVDSVCSGTSLTLEANASEGTPEYIYYWEYTNPDNPDEIIDSLTTEREVWGISPGVTPYSRYMVTVYDSHFCTAMDTLDVFVTEKQDLVIPNLITPNGDGMNDKLEIYEPDPNNQYVKHDLISEGNVMEIYNRWGQAVYRTENYSNQYAWDAANISDGIYYYYLQTQCADAEYKGWIHVISNTNN